MANRHSVVYPNWEKLAIWWREWIRSIRLQIGALAGTYALFVDGFLLLHYTIGESFVVIALLNHVAHWLTLGSVISFIVGWIAPYRRFWCSYAVPGVVAFMLWYGVWLLPNLFREPPDPPTQFTAVSYNMTEGYQNYTQKIQLVESMDADIIGMQEAGLTGPATVAIRDMYPYHILDAGLGLFSRFPIENDAYSWVGNNALRAVVTIDGQRVGVYVAHLTKPTLQFRPLYFNALARQRSIQQLVTAIRQDKLPVLLFCDCNMSDRTEDYRQLAAVLDDSWRQAGTDFGLTSPARNFPVLFLRIDYIWHSEAIQTLEVNVWPNSGISDHDPVWAKLGF